MLAASITQDQWEAVQRHIASQAEALTNVNNALAAAQARVSALETEHLATKAKLEPATKLLEKAGEKKPDALIDDKHMVKPTCDGPSKSFMLWDFKFKNFMCGKFPQADVVMKWARTQETEISIARADAKIKEIEGSLDFNNQLCAALANLLDSEPFSISINTEARNGLEVYRKLRKKYSWFESMKTPKQPN